MKTKPTLVLTLAALAVAAAAALAAGPLDDALAAFRAGEFEKCAEIASKVPEADPLRAKALYLVGEAEMARGRFDEAGKAFQAVLDGKADNVPALTGLGRAQCGAGDREAAEKTLRRAVQLDAKDAAARRALGETLTAAERYADARKELEAASKLDPKDPLTARALVEACLRGDDVDAAGKAADAFSKTAPDTAMAHFLKGVVLDRRGKADDAIEQYQKAVKADDRFLDAHRNLAVLYTTSNAMYANPGKVEKACAHAQRYIDLGGKDQELKKLLDQIQGFLEEMKKGSGGGRR